MSAEYVLAGGNPNVILCERGIRTFEKMIRNNLDISAVPLIKQKSHLPVIIDPSHAAGIAWMVQPLARTAIAAGADGLMIEVHNNPKAALCDGAQSLDPKQFDTLMTDVKRRVAFEEKDAAVTRKQEPDRSLVPKIRRTAKQPAFCVFKGASAFWGNGHARLCPGGVRAKTPRWTTPSGQ